MEKLDLVKFRKEAKWVLSQPESDADDQIWAERIILLCNEIDILRASVRRSLEKEMVEFEFNESANFEPSNIGFPRTSPRAS